MYRSSEENLLQPAFAENNDYRMHDTNNQFYQNYLPEIALEMWDEDISNMYKMDFISVLTSTLEDKSFFISPNATANSSVLQGTSSLIEERDNVLDEKCHHIPSVTDTTTTDSNDSSVKSLEETSVKQWTRADVAQWIKHHVNSFIPYDSLTTIIDKFQNIDGLALCSMSLTDFLSVSNNCGHFLHSKLQECLRSENTDGELHQLVPIESSYKDIPSDVVSLMLSDTQLNFSQGLREKLNKELNRELQSSVYLPTCLEEDFLNEQKQENSMSKKRPGRPRGIKRRKQSEQRLGRLWEFIRDLLLSEKYCPKYICWDNYEEGKFRFVESDKVAKLWGSIKGNANMNYEKFSRAMRYYYKSEVLLPVEGRRLVYKFGPKATGWRTTNPNFKL